MEFAIAFFGLLIGSFLNVCIWRIPRKMSIATPRSACPNCNVPIPWYDNFPVVSWLVLRGRCRACHSQISGRYPLIEAISLVAALAAYFRFGITPTGVLVFIILATLIVITFIDLDFMIIPNVINYPGVIIGLGLGIISEYWQIFDFPITQGILDSVIGMFLGAGFFYAIGLIYYLITKRVGLGGGDIKLLAMTGSLLGWQSVPTTIFYGSLFGATVGIITMLIKKTGRQTEIPFGPWLALGVVVYMFNSLTFP